MSVRAGAAVEPIPGRAGRRRGSGNVALFLRVDGVAAVRDAARFRLRLVTSRGPPHPPAPPGPTVRLSRAWLVSYWTLAGWPRRRPSRRATAGHSSSRSAWEQYSAARER